MKKNYILTLFLSLLISGFALGQGPMITIISDVIVQVVTQKW